MRIANLFLLFILLFSCSSNEITLSRKRTQNKPLNSNNASEQLDRPKLVVGIVVDQMRYDYLTRFYNRYGQDGFKRLLARGFSGRNNHFNFVPTYTAPGHASIYTGTTPSNHGIIGNNWYDKFQDQVIYNASDSLVQPVGSVEADGQMSPRQMLTSTITDELELHTQGKSQVIGISLKDRGAILPAGHAADAAYWFRGSDDGDFISSTFYMDELPQWVQKYNASSRVEQYLKEWNTYYPVESYLESGADRNDYERAPREARYAQFPYDLKKLSAANGNYDLLKATPYGNSIVTDFALEALINEQMGKDDVTDFLAISYSSTDYIGHQYGVNSIEVEDTYIRLDLEIARLLEQLDEEVGIGNYTIFLTADHGAVDVPNYLKSRKINSGYFNTRALSDSLNQLLEKKYEVAGLIKNISNNQIFLNKVALRNNELASSSVQQFLVENLVDYPLIDKVFKRDDIISGSLSSGVGQMISNGFHHKRSGDVVYVLEPAVISYGSKGSTHGSPQNHDTHVPMIFYGKGIKHGYTNERTEIVDIAPTIASLLQISFPNGCTGHPVVQALK